MRFPVWILLFAGCRSSNDAHAPPARVVDLVTPSASVAPLPSTAQCTVARSLAFDPKATASLENVRVVHSARTLVTWENADTDPKMGDSSISANAAWIDWSPAPKAAVVELPYRAYASAEWSRIGPTRALSLFTYGIAGGWGFALYDQNETTWRKLDINANPPPASKALAVSMALRESFAVADGAPVAVVAGHEAPCESWYACESKYQAASEKGFADSVRVVDLGAKPHSEIVWKASTLTRNPHKPTLVPAIAVGQTKSAVAFRLDQSIQLAWLDASFHPSPPTSIASADVGAPAVAFDGDRAIVAWAERSSASDPYHLVVWFDGAAHVVKTGTTSAFAPGLAARNGSVVLVWMEGDATSHGAVRMARMSFSGNWDLASATTLSDPSTNARDPEISMQGDDAVVVWSEFGKSSTIQARLLACK